MRLTAPLAFSLAVAGHAKEDTSHVPFRHPGNEKFARNAIRIMNAWAGTLTGGHTNENGPVQAAWAASVWPRAAEIIRHTSDF